MQGTSRCPLSANSGHRPLQGSRPKCAAAGRPCEDPPPLKAGRYWRTRPTSRSHSLSLTFAVLDHGCGGKLRSLPLFGYLLADLVCSVCATENRKNQNPLGRDLLIEKIKILSPKVTSDCGSLPPNATRCSKSTQDRSSSYPDANAETRRGFFIPPNTILPRSPGGPHRSPGSSTSTTSSTV